MKYTKEKTGSYYISFPHFLCHCITDSFLPIDIQVVLLVIHAHFLYHNSITTYHRQFEEKTGIAFIYN